MFLNASFNMALFFILACCFEPVYSGCIGCICGAGWTGSYLGVIIGINGAPGGPGFGPPLFPLGESILNVAGCFGFLVFIYYRLPSSCIPLLLLVVVVVLLLQSPS